MVMGLKSLSVGGDFLKVTYTAIHKKRIVMYSQTMTSKSVKGLYKVKPQTLSESLWTR